MSDGQEGLCIFPKLCESFGRIPHVLARSFAHSPLPQGFADPVRADLDSRRPVRPLLGGHRSLLHGCPHQRLALGPAWRLPHGHGRHSADLLVLMVVSVTEGNFMYELRKRMGTSSMALTESWAR